MTRPNRQKRRLPFLHRNWTTGITAYQTWPLSDEPRHLQNGCSVRPEDLEDDLYVRPSKRRRVGGMPVATGPLKHNECLTRWLPEYPTVRTHGLRVQVFNLFHQDTPRIRFNSVANLPPSEISTFSVRCKITIMSEKCGMPLLLYCDAQIATVQTHKSASGPPGVARLLLDPFTIPLEKVAILHEASGLFGLADRYKMRIEIESTGNEIWPPLDLVTFAGMAAHGHHLHLPQNKYRTKRADDCVLYAESNDFFGRPRMRIPLWLRESPRHDPVRTNFVMDMDVRWSTGLLAHPRKPMEKGVLPSIVALHPDDPCPAPTFDVLHDLTNGAMPRRYWDKRRAASSLANGTRDLPNGYANGHVDGNMNGVDGQSNGKGTGTSLNGVDSGVDDDYEEEAEGELTPSRSLRSRRDQPDYNLKNITNKAHGKGPRAVRKRLGRSMDYGSSNNSITGGSNKIHDGDSHNSKVTYIFAPEQLTVDGFVCCICMASNPNMNQLRVHFLSHFHYLFEYDTHAGIRGDNTVNVIHCPDESSNAAKPNIFQLGRPTKPLNLDKFLAGDDSWVTSRYGPQNDEKGHFSLVYAPRTKLKSKQTSQPKSTNLVVPHIKQQLYDPLSKVLLEPGVGIRPTVVDDDWLVHKHREVVQDYSDLFCVEKEFIQEWDKFIHFKRISSDAYIPRAMHEFVEEKGLWIVADTSRAIEFGKHMALMMARGLLMDEDIQEITRGLNIRRKRAQEQPELVATAEANAVPKTGPHRSKGGCTICGLPVMGPCMLMCANKKCVHRIYHSTCVKTDNIPVGRLEWFCNDCAGLARPA